MWRMQRWAW